MIDISIVIPHYDDLERLDACLTALSQQTFPAGRFEIVVADNRSPAGIGAVTDTVAGRARVVDAPERGAGPARNAGVAVATGDILAFTDCDCEPGPGWLEAGIEALEQADVVGGRMVVSAADDTRMTGAEAFERVFAFDNRNYVEKKGFAVTANLFCSRKTFTRVGPFRTGVSEDVDWCHRALALGYSLVYAQDAVVTHPAREDWAQLKRKWQRMNREQFALYKLKPWGRLRWIGKAVALPASVIVHAPRVLLSPALPDARVRLGALGILAWLRLWRGGDALSLGVGLRQ